MTTTHLLEVGTLPVIPAVGIVAVTYTASEITAFTIAVAALVTALGAVIVNIIIAVRQTRKVEENTALTQEVKASVKVVEGHVNSAASKAQAENEALTREIAAARQQLSELKQIAALLAQERAIASASMALAQAPVMETHLKEIEKNTKDTVVTLNDAMKDDKS